MKRIFISHKFTGVPYEELETYLGPVKQTLEQRGYEVFCSLWLENRFQEQGRTQEYIYERCKEQQATCDLVVGIIRHPAPSWGMRLELEYAQTHAQPYLLIVRKDLEQLERLAAYTAYTTSVVVVEDLADLVVQVHQFTFSAYTGNS